MRNDEQGHNLNRFVGRKQLITTIILLAFIVINSNARVFQRWNAVAKSDSTIEAVGGRIAYTAPINLNGGNGVVTVYSFKEDIVSVTKSLCRTFNTDKLIVKNGSMATTTITDGGMVLNLIAISMQPYGSTTLFKFVQTIAESNKSKNPPANPIKEVPAFPNTKTTFYAKDKQTKTAIAVATAKTSVQAVLDFYLSELPANGWSAPLSSSNNRHPTGQMMLYKKDNKLCCIFASDKPDTQQTSITILYKELKH